MINMRLLYNKYKIIKKKFHFSLNFLRYWQLVYEITILRHVMLLYQTVQDISTKLYILRLCHCCIINTIIFWVLFHTICFEIIIIVWLCNAYRKNERRAKFEKKPIKTVDFDFTRRLVFVFKVCRPLRPKTQEYTRGRKKSKKIFHQNERNGFTPENQRDVFIFLEVRSVCLCFFVPTE